MIDINEINWDKVNQLLPVIIQNSMSGKVLMLGYMNKEALTLSIKNKKVTFYSRTKKRLWTKGESSGNVLKISNISKDCDSDTLLIMAHPMGVTCHLGSESCFSKSEGFAFDFISTLDGIINQRYLNPSFKSYTSSLFSSGIKRMAQKVGEEGVEVSLAAVTSDRKELIDESSDLLYHLMVLLRGSEVPLTEVIGNLKSRHQEKSLK